MNEIWSISNGEYKGYSEDLGLVEKISRWKEVEMCGIYYSSGFKILGRDFIFPLALKRKITNILKGGEVSKTLTFSTV